MGTARLADLIRFYELLGRLENCLSGKRALGLCDGRMSWPKRGVYFFFERGEERSHTGVGLRVVRVGTHGLKMGSRTTLWQRLSQHRGVERTGGGNHRGSVFRLLIGTGLVARDPALSCDTWAAGPSASRVVREAEQPLEVQVSRVVREMSLLWVEVDDAAAPESLRGYVERNAIGLLSNYGASSVDPPSEHWLGLHSSREKVRLSGLWNVRHVGEHYDSAFLEQLEQLVS